MRYLIFLLIGIIGLHAQWVTLLQEDFESGMPANWTIVDENSDGVTWTVGITGDLGGYEPPNYGTQYAFYSDDDAGSGAPAGNEELITPSLSIAGMDFLKLIFSWGFRYYSTPNEKFQVEVRFHDGISWGSWQIVADLPGDSSGVDTVDLTSYLPAESLQIKFTYIDDGDWNWACGIDNISVIGYSLNYNMKVSQILNPGGIVDRNQTLYPEIEVVNTGQNDATYDAIFEVYDSSFSALLYSDTLLSNSTAAENYDTLNFTKGFNAPSNGWYGAKAYIIYSLDEYNYDDTLESQFYVFSPPESLVESFEGDSFPPVLWSTSGDVSWRQGPYYGDDIVEPSYTYDGAKYAVFPSFNTYAGLKGELISPFVHLNPAYGTPRVFFWGWNKGASNNEDTLKVFASTDGNTWDLIGVFTGSFEGTFAYDLSSYANQSIQIKFEGTSDDGISNIVIDYVKIDYGTYIEELEQRKDNVYRLNSISKNLKINFDIPIKTDMSFGLFSITGRKIDFVKERNLKGGYIYKKSLSSGIYIIKGKVGKKEINHKVIIIK